MPTEQQQTGFNPSRDASAFQPIIRLLDYAAVTEFQSQPGRIGLSARQNRCLCSALHRSFQSQPGRIGLSALRGKLGFPTALPVSIPAGTHRPFSLLGQVMSSPDLALFQSQPGRIGLSAKTTSSLSQKEPRCFNPSRDASAFQPVGLFGVLWTLGCFNPSRDASAFQPNDDQDDARERPEFQSQPGRIGLSAFYTRRNILKSTLVSIPAGTHRPFSRANYRSGGTFLFPSFNPSRDASAFQPYYFQEQPGTILRVSIPAGTHRPFSRRLLKRSALISAFQSQPGRIGLSAEYSRHV